MRHLWKKLIGWMLCLAMVVGMLPGMTRGAKAADVTIDGIRLVNGVYEISNFEGLSVFAKIVNGVTNPDNLANPQAACAILLENIDASSSTWSPIGTSKRPFLGIFDGKGKKITGLTIDNSSEYKDLFGYVTSGGKIQNLYLERTNKRGSDAGGVVGFNDGTVENCYNDSAVTGDDNVGGVVGHNVGTVINCYNTGAVSGNGKVGGVVGYNDGGTVINCYNTGAVRGNDSVGGVVGYNTNDGIITYCNNSGAVTGDDDKVGGVTGYNYHGNITYCFNTGEVSGENSIGGVVGISFQGTVKNSYNTGAVGGTHYCVGGIIGENHDAVINCYNIGAVSGNENFVGDVIGKNSGDVKNCYYDSNIGQIGAIARAEDTNAIGLRTDQMSGKDAIGTETMNFTIDEGESSPWMVRENDELFYSYYPHLKGFNMDKFGNQLDAEDIEIKDWPSRILKDGAREISNYDELKSFASEVNGGKQDIKGILLNDIDASASANGNPWTPIGSYRDPFTGVFDGNGHKILNLTVDSGGYYVGLFGYIKGVKDENGNLIGGIIQNVGLEGGEVKGDNCVGGLVGRNDGGRIINCYTTGAVTKIESRMDSYVGGLVGINSGTVQNCYNTCIVLGSDGYMCAGGVIGSNSGVVLNCHNNGDVSRKTEDGSSDLVGGVVGSNHDSGRVVNCYNTGNITGLCFVGGVVGSNRDSEVTENCYNTGSVTGIDYVGGVVGCNEANRMTTKTEECYNTGSVTGINYVGGVVGDNEDGTVSNCYNSGSVTKEGDSTTSSRTGGVVGYNDGGTVLNCHNTERVLGSQCVGGVVGRNEGSVTNCYNTSTVSGGLNVGGVVGCNSVSTVTNCYNTGTVNGSVQSGGVVGENDSGDIVYCYNTGDVIAKGLESDIGGVVGLNEGTTTNCYNTGDVKGKQDVGGVAGYNISGPVENCYNIGTVTGNDDYVGGVVGLNDEPVINCYNAGTVSGNSYVGAVIGENTKDLIKVENCYYDKSICLVGAINDSDASDNNVIGLTTPKMTGLSSALNGLKDVKDANGNPVWLFKENTEGTYFYPHLAGFNPDANGQQIPADRIPSDEWPNKVVFSLALSDESFTYNGEAHKPTAKEVCLNNTAQNGYKVTYLSSSDKEVDEPKDAGVYRAYVYSENGGKPGLEKSFEILPASVTLTANSNTVNYDGTEKNVSGFTCSIEGLTFTGISANASETKAGEYDVTFSGVVLNDTKDTTGNYVVTSIVGGTLTINPKSVTITATSASKDYDGTALTKDSVTAEGLATGDKIESITVIGSQTEVGKSDNVPSAAVIKNAAGEDVTANYVITYANGTLEITKKALTITADSASKEFDKTALTKDSYTSSGLADGDKIASVTITGSQTMKGSSDNVPSSAKIVNTAGEDVTGCYDVTYVNGTLTVTKPAAPKLPDDQKPAPKQDLKEDGKEQVLVLDPAKLPEGYTIEYSTDGGKTWKPIPTGSQSGEYTIEVLYKADENHTDFFGDPLSVIIQGVYNQTESDGDWTKGSGKTYTFRIKKAFNDETTYDNLTGVFVDGKPVEAGKDYTPAKGSAIITFAADYLETLSVGEHKIRVTFKDGETSVVLKILAAIATPTPAVDATPVTGDTANPFLWAAMVLLSMAGVAVMVEKKRKKA